MSGYERSKTMLDVKNAIKHLMIDKNKKAGAMAEELGMKTQAFSNWLYRADTPKVSTADEVLSALGCHLAIVDDETNEILF